MEIGGQHVGDARRRGRGVAADATENARHSGILVRRVRLGQRCRARVSASAPILRGRPSFSCGGYHPRMYTRFRSRGRATWLILLLWVSIFAVVGLVMNITQAPIVARATTESAAQGEIEIPRSRDGHYYVAGTINSAPVTFLIDTGATVTTVGPDLAQRAHLSGGLDARFDTAGGSVVGTTVSGATVVAGGLRVDDVRVAVLPSMGPTHALLGQNFLQYVAIEQRGDQLILRIPRRR